MLSVTLIFLLNASLVQGGCPNVCHKRIKHVLKSNVCKCTAKYCKPGTSNTGIGDQTTSSAACRAHCCANCRATRRSLQEESGNTTSVEESNITIIPVSNPWCFCYGEENNPFDSCPIKPLTNFEQCSEKCNSTCSGVGEGCEVSPVFVDEVNTFNDNNAKNYISEWQASGVSGSVCVCKLKGFKIGANIVFEEQECNEFCSQADSFGGVRYWLTTDEQTTSPPSSLPTWVVAFLSTVVCVGFIMITVLFCKNRGISQNGT